MAEPKKKTIVSASTGKEVKEGSAKPAKVVKEAAPVGNATPLRIGAVILWVLAIAFEILAILVYVQTIKITFMSTIVAVVILLVLDLICVIVAAQLWKKANRIDPASKKNKLKFWLWNNLGLIVAAFAFIPFIILALADKKADKKTKTIAVVVAIIALLIGGLCSYDWNPISAEEKDAAVAQISGNVYWTPFGHVYHTSVDCQALNNSDTVTTGSVEEAIAANRGRLCAFCAKRDSINTEGMLVDGDVDEVVLEEDE